jgi:hypothetical protein
MYSTAIAPPVHVSSSADGNASAHFNTGVSARNMRPPLFALTTIALLGCASPLRSAGDALSALSATATSAEPTLEAEYKSQQDQCLADHVDPVRAHVCVDDVRSSWRPVREGYRAFRRAWLAADAALRAAEAAEMLGQRVDMAGILALVTAALDAASAYRDLVSNAPKGATK